MERLIFIEENTVEFKDITNESHVGFELPDKGYIANIGESQFNALFIDGSSGYCNNCVAYAKRSSIQATIEAVKKNYSNIKFYRFNSRKELYKWLSK